MVEDGGGMVTDLHHPPPSSTNLHRPQVPAVQFRPIARDQLDLLPVLHAHSLGVGQARAVENPASPEGRGGQGVRTTLERLAVALGPKYDVKRLIGRGGFAEVYELWDKDLDRRLACKVLHPEIAWTPGMLARFRQEAKALARLQHPAILPIHFAGDGEGLVYYVMPFVEGESLADALRRRGPHGAGEALVIAEPVLQALGPAHAQGLLHRDCTPDNVMLEAKTGRALLLDFGIAKLLRAGGGRT